jgi:hypothetical protein
MCSFYPRTQIVQFNAMLSYQEAVEESQTLNETFDIYYSRIARLIVESLDSVRTQEPLLKGDQKKLQTLYQWVLTFPGGGIDKLVSKNSVVDQILTAKIRKGIA